jgi:hypothetical protein
MSAVGGFVKIAILLLVSMVIYSSLAAQTNIVQNRCNYTSPYWKNGCGICCQKAQLVCNTYCKGCLAWKNKQPCFVHLNNKNYMKYFYTKDCHKKCGLTKPGRELENDASYFFSKMVPNYLRQDDEELMMDKFN